jgi:hypothetical protein
MATIAIKVTVDAAHLGRTDQMCQTLSQMGMVIETAMPEIGVIFGSGDAQLLPKMQAVEGVTEAVAERTMRTSQND